MTVNPGFGGQAYIPTMVDKIKKIRGWIVDQGLDVDIEVDGGIKADWTIAACADAGASRGSNQADSQLAPPRCKTTCLKRLSPPRRAESRAPQSHSQHRARQVPTASSPARACLRTRTARWASRSSRPSPRPRRRASCSPRVKSSSGWRRRPPPRKTQPPPSSLSRLAHATHAALHAHEHRRAAFGVWTDQ
eukprot:6958241-Prymnesium_polylepis.1